MAEVLFEWASPFGTQVSVVRGDLTLERVDVIVNAANEQLEHGGGVASAIVRRGGASIQEESRAWVAAQGPVPTGAVAFTGAGELRAHAVIHAVGPVWGVGGEPALLATAVRRALELAAEQGYESISLPAISSGIYGFPKQLCAQVLLQTVETTLAGPPGRNLREVRLCNIDGPTAAIFAEEARGRWGG